MFQSRQAGWEESELNNGGEGGTVAFFVWYFFSQQACGTDAVKRKIEYLNGVSNLKTKNV